MLKNVDYSIILCGFMGCGKTTIGKLLSERLNLEFIDTDECIELKTNLQISQIFKEYGEPYFRDLESRVIQDVSSFSPCVLSLGGGSLENKQNIVELKKMGKIVFLNASINLIKIRLKNDISRPLIKDRKNLEKLFYSRLETYTNASDIIVCANYEPSIVCDYIINMLSLKEE